MDRSALEQRLATCRSFEEPTPAFEQYATPAALAAHVIHLADLQGDLGRPVVDLGCGPGILALGAAISGAAGPIVGVERDPTALRVAQGNARALEVSGRVEWLRADARRLPVSLPEPATVLSNPPFGAVRGQTGADRAFLKTAARLGGVSYTFHNAGSEAFLDAVTSDWGGALTHLYEGEFDVPRQFPWHEEGRASLSVLIARIDWE
ncbi:MAG: METTL5 family protein [Halobacteriaceae archaeon]